MNKTPLPLALTALEAQDLAPGTKGLPNRTPLRQADIAAQGWRVLDGQLSYPVAVLKDSALAHNARWMQDFAARAQALLAPHGKTTMSPQLFELQRQAGAWALTVATMRQLLTAYRFGVRRLLLANQPVAPADLDALFALLHEDAGFEPYVLVDSAAGLQRLADAAARAGAARALPVLVELGAAGGRTGARGLDEAQVLARAVAATPGLLLAGVEGYEGLWVTADRAADLARVRAFLHELVELARRLDGERLFGGAHILLSAGGSAYFDLVAEALAGAQDLSLPLQRVLRSGCYLTHDHGFYDGLLHELAERQGSQAADGLRPALEVWAMVQSRPEPDLALLTLGKRDAGHDIHLPHPQAWHRPGQDLAPQPLREARVEKMNDQHAYLRLPAGHALAVGDLVCLGISHPCTTFDKWQLLLGVDDDYRVTRAINTFF